MALLGSAGPDPGGDSAMSDADTTGRTAIGKGSSPLSVAARRSLWDAIWKRLLAPVSEESRNRYKDDWLRGDDDPEPLAPVGDQPADEAA